MFAQMMAAASGGGGFETMKEFIRDKVFNGGFSTTYDFVPYSDRATVNEGKIAIDTENSIVYLYADFTMKGDFTSGNYFILNTSPLFPSNGYRPRGASSLSIIDLFYLDRLVDVATSQAITWTALKFSYYSVSITGISTNNINVKNGERYVMCGSWQY